MGKVPGRVSLGALGAAVVGLWSGSSRAAQDMPVPEAPAAAPPSMAGTVPSALPPAVATQEPIVGPSSPPRYRLHLGAQSGFTFPLGIVSVARVLRAGQPWWDVDAVWEPSRFLQSYSAGAAFHPLGGPAYVGPRVRWLQVHPPWARGYAFERDDYLGLGVDAGLRTAMGATQRLLLGASLGATWVPTQGTSLQVLMAANVSLAWAVVQR